jgi:hypothetical protein
MRLDSGAEVRIQNHRSEALDVGHDFVRALSAKDGVGLASILDPQIDFRGLTPSNEWCATDLDGVLEIVFGSWFEPGDDICEVMEFTTHAVADRHHLRYRLRVENVDGMHLVEQQGYYDAVDGRITRMSLVCSGYRPWEDGPAS